MHILCPDFWHQKKIFLLWLWKIFCNFCSIVRLLTFIVVVLHCDDASSGCFGIVDDGLRVQRFDGERVDHTDVDSLWWRREEGGCSVNNQNRFIWKTALCRSHKAECIVQSLLLTWLGFLLSVSLSLYLSLAVQLQPEPRGESLLLQSQSRGHHWFCTQPER